MKQEQTPIPTNGGNNEPIPNSPSVHGAIESQQPQKTGSEQLDTPEQAAPHKPPVASEQQAPPGQSGEPAQPVTPMQIQPPGIANLQQDKELAYRMKRRLYLLLPILCVPGIILIFASQRGGTGWYPVKPDNGSNGFNLNLPALQLHQQEKPLDKVHAYQKADADSIRRSEYQRQDPYHQADSGYRQPSLPAINPWTSHLQPTSRASIPGGLQPLSPADGNSDRLLHQLENLQRSLQQPSTLPPAGSYSGADPLSRPPFYAPRPSRLTATANESPFFNNFRRELQSIHDPGTPDPGEQAPNTHASESDPQLDKLNGMLDKIIHIQHAATGQQEEPSTPVNPTSAQTNRSPAVPASPVSAIPAIVQEDQTLISGATIALLLTADAIADEIKIPAGQLVYGTVALHNDRMLIDIHSFRMGTLLYPVSWQAYDLDGLPGIHIPSMLSREVAKQSADQGINSIGLAGLDQGLQQQAAQAGIQAVKTLLIRKVRQVRITVPAGYQVLIRDMGRSGSIAPLANNTPSSPLPHRYAQPGEPSQLSPTFTYWRTELPMLGVLPHFLAQRVHRDKMELTLQGIWLRDSLQIFCFELRNRSLIDFIPAYSRWFIRDRYRMTRTAIQEVAQNPVMVQMPATIPGNTKENIYIGFSPITLPEDKELIWQLSDKSGGRLLHLVITPYTLLRTRK